MLEMQPFGSSGGSNTPSLDNYEFTFETYLQDSAQIVPDVSASGTLLLRLPLTHCAAESVK